MDKKNLSLKDWHALAQSGVILPIRPPIDGCSMRPFIRRECDEVTVLPLDGQPVPGDIVLFYDPGLDKGVLHRVWLAEPTRVLTWGDNNLNTDGWIPIEYVWGKVVSLNRKGRHIKLNSAQGIRWAKFWHNITRNRYNSHTFIKKICHRIKGKP